MEKTKGLPKGVRYKENGIYEARKMINGKVITASGKDLSKVLEEFNRKIEAARKELGTEDYTLTEWFDVWYDSYKKPSLKATSHHTTKNRFNRTFGFALGGDKLNVISSLSVQKAINGLVENGVGTSQIRSALSTLKECLDAAVANQYISVNPAVAIKVPWVYKEATEEIALTEAEQNLFLGYLEDCNSWYYEMFCFLLLTGVRVGELGGLQWEDIDFNKKEIHIKHNLSCSYEDGIKRMCLTTLKTSFSVRVIPFMGEMEEILSVWKYKYDNLKKNLGVRWRMDASLGNPVFVTTMGSPCTRYIVEKEIKKVSERINNMQKIKSSKSGEIPQLLPDFHPHSLRHTFITRCAERGISMEVTQRLAGHSSINITNDIYTHINRTKRMQETEKFGSLRNNNSDELPKFSEVILPISARSHL